MNTSFVGYNVAYQQRRYVEVIARRHEAPAVTEAPTPTPESKPEEVEMFNVDEYDDWICPTPSPDSEHNIPNNAISKPVMQLTKEGREVERFPSIKAAEDALNIKGNKISAVTRGERITAGGFKWKIIEKEAA